MSLANVIVLATFLSHDIKQQPVRSSAGKWGLDRRGSPSWHCLCTRDLAVPRILQDASKLNSISWARRVRVDIELFPYLCSGEQDHSFQLKWGDYMISRNRRTTAAWHYGTSEYHYCYFKCPMTVTLAMVVLEIDTQLTLFNPHVFVTIVRVPFMKMKNIKGQPPEGLSNMRIAQRST